MIEETLILVKPDGVQRGLVGEIIRRFEQSGFKMLGMRMQVASKELMEQHYEEHKGKEYFDGLVGFMISGPLVSMVWQGYGIVRAARSMIGVTDPLLSAPGTIRGDFAISVKRSVIHGSDSTQSAIKEVSLWFPEINHKNHEMGDVPHSRL